MDEDALVAEMMDQMTERKAISRVVEVPMDEDALVAEMMDRMDLLDMRGTSWGDDNELKCLVVDLQMARRLRYTGRYAREFRHWCEEKAVSA